MATQASESFSGESGRNPRCVSPMDRRAQAQELVEMGLMARICRMAYLFNPKSTGPRVGYLNAQMHTFGSFVQF
jgi:hypothetical protein